MIYKNIFFHCFVLIGVCLSCNKENFDETISNAEVFTPEVTLLGYGTWEFDLDTMNVQIDTSWVVKSEFTGSMYGMKVLEIIPPWPNSPAEATIAVQFLDNTGDSLFEEGVYDLLKLEYWDLNMSMAWEADQIEGSVEITNAEEVYDPFWNFTFNEISGFITTTLTDSDGTEHEFSSTFNKIRQN